jgi:hypothetical protein
VTARSLRLDRTGGETFQRRVLSTDVLKEIASYLERLPDAAAIEAETGQHESDEATGDRRWPQPRLT